MCILLPEISSLSLCRQPTNQFTPTHWNAVTLSLTTANLTAISHRLHFNFMVSVLQSIALKLAVLGQGNVDK
jgi:hypothetical protein